MLCSERRVAPLVHCGSQAWVTAEKQGELGESGVQVLDAPQGVVHRQTRVVAGGCDQLRLLSTGAGSSAMRAQSSSSCLTPSPYR